MTEPKNELQRNAVTEARNKELRTCQRDVDMAWLNSRMADGRMGRCLALIKREEQMEKDFQERTDHAAIVNEKARYESALAKEVADISREEAVALLRRHELRERVPELRDLSRRLHAGYVCRDQRQQILHNEYRALQVKAEEKRANTILNNAIYNDLEHEAKVAREDAEHKAAYRHDLQQQLVNKEQQRQCQYEDTLIEKKMLEDIMRTIYDEDMREIKQKKQQLEQTKEEMLKFHEAQLAWKEKQKMSVVLEEKQIEEQLKMLGDRSLAVIEERERKNRIKEELNKKICDKILADEFLRQERVDTITMLQQQEYIEKGVQDAICEKEKLERKKKDTKEALTRQMNTKKTEAIKQKHAESRFREQCEAKLIEGDKKEEEKQQKAMEQKKKYAADLRQQILGNEQRRKEDVIAEARCLQNLWDYQANRDIKVAEEREKMVEEHAPRVLGYLQAGVLKHKDLLAVRAGANKHQELATLDIDAIAASKGVRRRPKCNEQCRRIRDY